MQPTENRSGSPLTLLVTGATGKVGRPLVDRLLEDGHDVRALTRSPGAAGLPPEVELFPGDPMRPAALADAARGADAVFLNWMGFDATGAGASADALAAEVDHVVYLSAAQLQAGTRGVMPGVWSDVEDALTATGVDCTFVRSGAFAANALAWADAIRDGRPVLMPHPGAVRSPVHEADVADVARRCLTDPGLRGRAVEVTGPEQLSRREEVETIGRVLGRPVSVVQQDVDEAREQLAAWSSTAFADAAFAYWAGLAHDPERVSIDAEEVIGRPRRSFAQWVVDHERDFATS